MKAFIFFIFLIPLTAVAQKDCVEIKNSITGKVNKLGIVKMFSANSSILNFIKQGDDYTVNYLTILTKSQPLLVSDSLHVLFEFNNGLKRDVTTSNLSTINSDSTSLNMRVTFISKNITPFISEFRKYKLSSITIGSDSNYTMTSRLEIPEGLADRIINTVICITE